MWILELLVSVGIALTDVNLNMWERDIRTAIIAKTSVCTGDVRLLAVCVADGMLTDEAFFSVAEGDSGKEEGEKEGLEVHDR